MPLKQYARVLPGRLARERQADAEPRAALRPDHRLPDRSVEEPELREGAGGRRRRAARRASRGWRTSASSPKDDKNNSSRASASPSTCAATAATSSAAAGASTTTWATPTRTCCSRPVDATGHRLRRDLQRRRPPGIRNPGRQLLPASGQPTLEHRSQNQVNTSRLPLFGQWLDPRFELPYTRQTAFGWSHQLMHEHGVHGRLRAQRGARSRHARRDQRAPDQHTSTAPRQLAFLGIAAERASAPAARSASARASTTA